jgi:hypothetical protein
MALFDGYQRICKMKWPSCVLPLNHKPFRDGYDDEEELLAVVVAGDEVVGAHECRSHPKTAAS